MEPLAALTRRVARDGRVGWIGVRPERKAPLRALDAVAVAPDGLDGDHARAGKRAVTLVQAEHLPAIAAFAGLADIAPGILRRNILISGLNLGALRGACVSVGSTVLRISGPCAPCSRMEKALGPGGYTAMRGHGGWCASVERPGTIRLGDAVRPLFD